MSGWCRATTGGSVTGCGALPGDRDGDVDAEHAGQDGSGRSAVSWNSAAVQAGPEQMPAWRRRSAMRKALMGRPGWPPGNSHEELSWLSRAAWPRRAAATCLGQRVARFGQDDGLAAKAKQYFVAVVVEVIEGKAADRRSPLSVADDEQPGQPVFGFESLVVDQAAGLLPAGLGVDRGGRAAWPSGRSCPRRCGERPARWPATLPGRLAG